VGTRTKAEKKEKRKLVRGDTNQDREEREKEIGSWGHKPRQRRKRKGNWFVGTRTKAEWGDTNQGGIC